MTRTRKTPRETVLTKSARITRQSRGSRSVDRTSRARNDDSESPFPPLRSLSPFNARIKAEVQDDGRDAMMLSVEEKGDEKAGDLENPAIEVAGKVKEEEAKVASVETDEVKLAELRLNSVDRPEDTYGITHPSPSSSLPSIQALLGADAELQNSDAYREFLKSYSPVTEVAAGLRCVWDSDISSIQEETPSLEQRHRLEAFRSEFLNGLRMLQGMLSKVHPAHSAHVALLQAIRRFLSKIFQLISGALDGLHFGPNGSHEPGLKVRIAVSRDLVLLLANILARMIKVAGGPISFPHQIHATWRIQSAVSVCPLLQNFGFPPTLLLPQFVTGKLIVANADFL